MKYLDKLLYYLPQLIVVYYTICLIIILIDAKLYKELFQYIDFTDAVLCIIAFSHLCTVLYRRLSLGESYVISWATILLILILNISLDLLNINNYVYFSLYVTLLLMNYTYFYIKEL